MSQFAATDTRFSEFPLDPYLLKSLEEAGYANCMPVQAQTLPHTLEGRDIFVQSQTGSGKTAAFLVSLFQVMLDDTPEERGLAMIIAPTRELAVQIEEEAKLLGKFLSLTTGCFYGGVGYYNQERMLSEGVDIMIGTPGRILDLNQKGLLHLKKVKYLIIDEADRLFDMGFYPDIRRMISRMPPREQRQTMLFSATLDYRVRTLASENMNNPATVEITPEVVTVDKITQELYHVGKREKMNLLLGLLNHHQPNSAIIFTNTKHMAEEISERMAINGYVSEFLMGDLAQSKRLSILEKLKSGAIKFLIATDIAARGIHIDDLELVINYDIPQDAENYVHRIGRTARAGKSGKAITFACETFVEHLSAVEKYIGAKIPVAYASEELYIPDASAGMHIRKTFSDRNRPGMGGGRGDSRGGRDSRDGRSGSRSDSRSSGGSSRSSSQGSSSRSGAGSQFGGRSRNSDTHAPSMGAPRATEPRRDIPPQASRSTHEAVAAVPKHEQHTKRPENPNRRHHAEKGAANIHLSNPSQHEKKPSILHKVSRFLFGKH